jgi:hypothetical protein
VLAVLAVAACGTRTPLLLGEGEAAGLSDAASLGVDGGGSGVVLDGSPLPVQVDASPVLDGGAPVADAHVADVESPQCQALHAEVDQLRPQATVCDPTSTATQCLELAADVCCLIWIDSPPPPAAVEFVGAVTQYVQECHPSCGTNPCQVAQNSHCDPSGHCVWGPKGP